MLKISPMEEITIKDKRFVKYISYQEIDTAIEALADKINNDYKGRVPIFLVVLNGAIMFASDLMKKLNIDCELSAIKVSSYVGTSSTQNVKQLIGIKDSVEGRDIIIVEDIVDTGITIDAIIKELEARNVASIRIATMTYKKEAYTKKHPIDYVALEIPNKFIVGYGLDYDELGRNYKDIYQIIE